jgi:hypothetical protein
MKAIETTARLTEDGQLTLDKPLALPYPSQVRVIVLVPDADDDGDDRTDRTDGEDEDSTQTIVEGLQEGWQQALQDQTHPVSELWDQVGVE